MFFVSSYLVVKFLLLSFVKMKKLWNYMYLQNNKKKSLYLPIEWIILFFVIYSQELVSSLLVILRLDKLS